MFNLNETVLFDRPVNNGQIGLMEKDIFFSLGEYYSKKNGSIISTEELLKIDRERLLKIQQLLKLSLPKFKKELLLKEYKVLEELLLLKSEFKIKNYSTLRSMIYYILNSAKSCNEKFVFANVGHDKRDFRIAFTKSKNSNVIEPIVLSNQITDKQYKDSLTKDYANSFEIINFEDIEDGSEKE